MTQEDNKRTAAQAALKFVEDGTIVGVGTGSTTNYFIDALAQMKARIDGAVASSEASAARLKALSVPLLELNGVNKLAVYVDGADEATRHGHLIKGGGGALTREKIIAQAALKFVCIVDDSKIVARLGEFPLPIEVVPMARSFVARELAKAGGTPEWRQSFVTDNGNHIIDVYNLDVSRPVQLEEHLNQIPGIVTNGLFARRPADVLLVGSNDGVQRIE